MKEQGAACDRNSPPKIGGVPFARFLANGGVVPQENHSCLFPPIGLTFAPLIFLARYTTIDALDILFLAARMK